MTDVSQLTPFEAAERLASLSSRTKAALDEWKTQSWEKEEQPYAAFRVIGAAVASKRAPPPPPEMESLFAFAERLLVRGGDDVPNMVATAFLEEIWKGVRTSGFDFSLVDRHLGPQARAYLLAWDRFDASSTPGLKNR